MERELDVMPERTRPLQSPTLLPRAERLLALFGLRAQPNDPRLARLCAAAREADPLADALVEAFERVPAATGHAMFERALVHGVASVSDAPPELVALFTQLESDPPWLDRALLQQGADAMVRLGAEGLCALSAVSLMSGYLSSVATKPLAHTGALVRAAPRRLAETVQYVHAVTSVGGMERAAVGFQATVRVRLVHARVRRTLREAGTFPERWGVPVSARDMVGTHLTFTLMFIVGASALGRVVSARERDAIMHLWRYISCLLGTPDELVPKSFREAVEIGALFNISEPGPDADGRALAAALMEAWRGGGPRGGGRVAQLVGEFMVGYARYALGREAAERLNIPETAWRFLPPLLVLLRLPNELIDHAFPGRLARGIAAGRRLMDHHSALAARSHGVSRPVALSFNSLPPSPRVHS